jgi:hypothetical protein
MEACSGLSSVTMSVECNKTFLFVSISVEIFDSVGSVLALSFLLFGCELALRDVLTICVVCKLIAIIIVITFIRRVVVIMIVIMIVIVSATFAFFLATLACAFAFADDFCFPTIAFAGFIIAIVEVAFEAVFKLAL